MSNSIDWYSAVFFAECASEYLVSLFNSKERTASTVAPLLSELQTVKTPPTYHRTNKFTVGFQNIIDAYGIATYGEVNPGLFTTITFPFFFAVMFGDIGHGLLMFLGGLYLVLREKELGSSSKGEMFSMLYGGRYMVLFMGFFSMYTGLLYNDMFSRALNFFGTGYEFYKSESSGKYEGTKLWTYAFGLDPASLYCLVLTFRLGIAQKTPWYSTTLTR